MEFEAGLERYQQRLYDEADEAEERSWAVAARPLAAKEQVPCAGLRLGDFITSDGVRWARVVRFAGPACNVKRRDRDTRPADDEVSILFEIPEPVTVSGETRYWIERKLDEPITIDRNARSEP